MNRKILRLAIPNIISNLTVPLLSSVDTALMGHLEEVYYLGAIAVGGMIFNFVYWGFGFLRMGTTGLTAQAYGYRDDSESFRILLRALAVAVGGGLLIILGRAWIADLSFALVNASENVETHARIYFNIRVFAAPATLAGYALTGWLLGMQNARYPMYIAIVTNGLNIIFNLVYLKFFGMKADGVALGTVTANYLGLIFTLILIRPKYRELLGQKIRREFFNWQKVKPFFALNRDIFIRTLLLIFAFSFFTAKSAEAGEELLAINSILINLWTIMSYGIDGFAFAAESIVGNYFGAGNRKKLLQAVKYAFYWGIAMGVVLVLVYSLFAKPILYIFTDKSDLVDGIMKYYFWTAIAPVINAFCYIWDGIFIGATAGKSIRNTMIFSTLGIYLPAYYLTWEIWGNHGLWFSLLFFMVMRGVSMGFMFRKQILARI